jgi:biopolymer transport protein ExbD
MLKRRKRDIPELNTTSTADISFMLLIFFLVTSSMDTDKGMTRQLPPPEDETQEEELIVKRRNVMQLKLDADNRLTCNGEDITTDELTQRVREFVANTSDDPEMPEKSEREVNLIGRCRVSDRHVIFIEADRKTTYNAYFEMENAIVRGYNELRNELSQRYFSKDFAQCTQEQRDAVSMVYPQRISERVGDGALQ